jgi:hypothetical protein
MKISQRHFAAIRDSIAVAENALNASSVPYVRKRLELRIKRLKEIFAEMTRQAVEPTFERLVDAVCQA